MYLDDVTAIKTIINNFHYVKLLRVNLCLFFNFQIHFFSYGIIWSYHEIIFLNIFINLILLKLNLFHL